MNPSINEHETKTYPNTKSIRKKLHPVNLRNGAVVKAEELLTFSFIYPISMMEQVSNPVLVDKMQGDIHVCTKFNDLNKACYKDNYPTPFIDQIIDACAGSEVFSFMDGE